MHLTSLKKLTKPKLPTGSEVGGDMCDSSAHVGARDDTGEVDQFEVLLEALLKLRL